MLASSVASTRTFTALIEPRPRGGVAIKLPFNPAAEWGDRDRYDVTGAIAGRKVRAKLILGGTEHYLELGPACAATRVWRRAHRPAFR